jgi:poly(A) polymerase
LFQDKECLEIINLAFPQLINISALKKLNSFGKQEFSKVDFIFLISLMIIDGTDNADYFIYKFNISKKDQKRIKIINDFYQEKISSKTFSENRMNRIFYYDGKQAVCDILNYHLIKSKKIEKNLMDLIHLYKNKSIPKMPIGADTLMTKFKIPEGKQLGTKLKTIEEEWVKNNFKISDKQITYIVNN